MSTSIPTSLPYQVAAEEEAEDEDKDRCPKHHNVDIKREVLKPYIWHPETVVREIGAHGSSGWRKINDMEGMSISTEASDNVEITWIMVSFLNLFHFQYYILRSIMRSLCTDTTLES